MFKVNVTLTFEQITSKSLGVIYRSCSAKIEYCRSKNNPVIYLTSVGIPTNRLTCAKQSTPFLWKGRGHNKNQTRSELNLSLNLIFIHSPTWSSDLMHCTRQLLKSSSPMIFYWLIEWWRFNAVFYFSVNIKAAKSPTHVFLIPVLHYNSLPKQLSVFPYRLLAYNKYWWRTSDACHIEFCKKLERILAKLVFKLTNPGLISLYYWL